MSGEVHHAMRRPFSMLPPKRLLIVISATLVFIWLLLQGHSIEPVKTRYEALTKSRKLVDDVNNSTLGFEKIFVMGLASRTDRRDGMILQAALSNLAIEFVDGVSGDSVYEKAIITGESGEHMTGGALGAWRGHINVLQEIVRRNISSALILEDDVDWDIRIRSIMRELALSAHALTQPLAGTGPTSYADPTYPQNTAGAQAGSSRVFDFHHLPAVRPPHLSPYGDEWQAMWLGHCGTRFPSAESGLPMARVIRRGDVTVPPSGLWSMSQPFELVEQYEPRTRAVHHNVGSVCSLGYAVTQQGARALLLDSGLREATDAFDLTLQFFCEGLKGRRRHNCLTIQPPIFNHHRPAGNKTSNSEIGSHGVDYNPKAFTDMIQWSVRLNADAILEGKTKFEDQFK